MKKYFVTGFIALLPIALTILIALWLFNLFTDPLAGLMEALIISYERSRNLSPEHHHLLVLFLSRIFAFILLVAIILCLGVFGQKFLVHHFLTIGESILQKIPFVRSIFRITHDITNAVLSDDKKTFQETILVPFPTSEQYAMGFVTGTVPPCISTCQPSAQVAIFVPTAPHPISGFLLLVPKSQLSAVNLSTEEAFKFLISCGTLQPKESPEEKIYPM